MLHQLVTVLGVGTSILLSAVLRIPLGRRRIGGDDGTGDGGGVGIVDAAQGKP